MLCRAVAPVWGGRRHSISWHRVHVWCCFLAAQLRDAYKSAERTNARHAGDVGVCRGGGLVALRQGGLSETAPELTMVAILPVVFLVWLTTGYLEAVAVTVWSARWNFLD